MKKRIVAMISAAVMAATLLAGCGSSGSTSASSASSANAEASSGGAASGDAKIGMVVNNSGADPYQSAYYETMTDYAKEQGVNLQILDPKGDATKQAEQIQDLINMNCDCIIVCHQQGGNSLHDGKYQR